MAEGTGCPSPWTPETSQHRLAILGKLAEEGSEVATAATRCIIQGIDEREPETGKLNREWLEDEIADVLAQIERTQYEFDLDIERIMKRANTKYNYTKAWQDTLRGK